MEFMMEILLLQIMLRITLIIKIRIMTNDFVLLMFLHMHPENYDVKWLSQKFHRKKNLKNWKRRHILLKTRIRI